MMVLSSWWAEALLKKIPGPDWIFAKMREKMGDKRIRRRLDKEHDYVTQFRQCRDSLKNPFPATSQSYRS